jgi:hypothetical protein
MMLEYAALSRHIIIKYLYFILDSQDNSAWTLSMDREILEWISKEPQDWWQKTQSTVYTWGKGSWNQLGTSTRENSSPALAEEWKDVQQVPNCYMFVGVDCSSHKECSPATDYIQLFYLLLFK